MLTVSSWKQRQEWREKKKKTWCEYPDLVQDSLFLACSAAASLSKTAKWSQEKEEGRDRKFHWTLRTYSKWKHTETKLMLSNAQMNGQSFLTFKQVNLFLHFFKPSVMIQYSAESRPFFRGFYRLCHLIGGSKNSTVRRFLFIQTKHYCDTIRMLTLWSNHFLEE